MKYQKDNMANFYNKKKKWDKKIKILKKMIIKRRTILLLKINKNLNKVLILPKVNPI